MKKNIIFATTFLVLALVMAYWASLPQQESDSSESVWTRLAQDSVYRIHYQDKQVEVDFFRNEQADGQFWIKTVEPAAKEGDEPVTTVFKASDKYVQVLEFFEPLKVDRVIGDEDKVDAKEFGFDSDEAATLKISDKAGQTLLDFKLGKRSFGSRNYFAIDTAKKKVLLFNGSRMEDVAKAKTRLYERSPFNTEFAELDAADLKVGSKLKSFWRTQKDKDGAVGWSDASANAAVKASYNGWMRKVQNLRVIHYADQNKWTELQANAPLFTVDFKRKGKVIETISLLKTKNDAGKFDYWITSKYIGGFAKVNETRAETIEKDVPVILGES